MFKSFINGYKREYFKIFTDDFYGRFKKFQNTILEPKFHASNELKNELDKIDAFATNPISIAIVGQFSSGKSTFLNALLGDNILPTGITPVTAKLTHIRYGEKPLLKVSYKNKKELITSIDKIANFVDQRVFSDDVNEIFIYTPSEILKHVNFIDTPGLNSLSNSDTAVTKGILKDVCAVIWISLIQNAARASEIRDLNELLKNKNAICVLNQKDKLDQIELQRVLKHARHTYQDNFKQIIEISAKDALKGILDSDKNLLENSNFNSILDAINKHFKNDKIKEKFIILKCENFISQISTQHEQISNIHKKAMKILEDFDKSLDDKLQIFKLEFSPKIQLAFNEIKTIAKFIADEIMDNLKTKKMSRFASKKTLFKNEIFQKIEYEMMWLDSDEIFSKLIYNDIKILKFFRVYRRNLEILKDEMKLQIDKIYAKLEQDFMIYKSEFENIIKENDIYSDIEFAKLKTHAGKVYEIFLRDFEIIKIQKEQKLSLFFEKLNLKVIANYENAIKIAVHFLKDKIEQSANSYEKDPLHFALFIPSANECYDRVLTSLSLYEFENEMLGHASFLNKIANEIKAEFNATCKEKLQTIEILLKRHNELKNEILSIKLQRGR